MPLHLEMSLFLPILITLSALLILIYWFQRNSSNCKLKPFGELLSRSHLRDICQYCPEFSPIVIVIPPTVIVLFLVLDSFLLGWIFSYVVYIVLKACSEFQFKIEVMGFQFDHPRQANALIQSLSHWVHEPQDNELFIPITLCLLIFSLLLLIWFNRYSIKYSQCPAKLKAFGDLLRRSLLQDRPIQSGPVIPPRIKVIPSLLVGGPVSYALYVIIKTCWEFHLKIDVLGFSESYPSERSGSIGGGQVSKSSESFASEASTGVRNELPSPFPKDKDLSNDFHTLPHLHIDHPSQANAFIQSLSQWVQQQQASELFISITLCLLTFSLLFLIWFKRYSIRSPVCLAKIRAYRDLLHRSLLRDDLAHQSSLAIPPRLKVICLVPLSLLVGGPVSYVLYVVLKTCSEFHFKIEVMGFQFDHPRQANALIQSLSQWVHEQQDNELFIPITVCLPVFSLLFLIWSNRYSIKSSVCPAKLRAFGDLLRRSLLRDLGHQSGPIISPMLIVICFVLISLLAGGAVSYVLYIIIKTCWEFHLKIEVLGFQFDHPNQANALIKSMFQEREGLYIFLPITIFLLLLTISFLYWFNRTSFKLPPSPPKLPLIGNIHQLGQFLHHSLRDLSDKCGPLMSLRLGNVHAIVISSPEMAKEITKTHELVFTNRPAIANARPFLRGGGDVGPGGEHMSDERKCCIVELLSKKRVQSYKLIRKEEVGALMEDIKRSCLTGGAINLTELLSTVATNLISRVALGKTYHQQDGTSKLRQLLRDVTTLMGTFSVEDFYPLLRWVDVLTGFTDRMEQTSNAMNEFLEQVIADHETSKSHGDENDFVGILLRADNNGTLNISNVRDNIKAIILDIFLAGTGTISSVVEWAMVELIRNPEIMKRAQKEVRQLVYKDIKGCNCEACRRTVVPKLEEDDLQNMKFLKCVVKEVLRLHPSLPVLVPRESCEVCQLDGYSIPDKARVFINTWAIQRDPKLWNHPEDFMPERFIVNNQTADSEGFDEVKDLPFGAGSRTCPGMSFALIASEFVLAHLLFWFDWSLPSGSTKDDTNMHEAFGLTLNKKNHVHLVPTLYK